jgi:hypothetical protein
MQNPLSAEVLPEPVYNWQAPAFGGTRYACTMAIITSKKKCSFTAGAFRLAWQSQKKEEKGF